MDHVVTEKINTNKDQLNDSIYNEPTFDTNSFNSSSGTRNPLPVVNVTLRGGKKHIAMTVAGLKFLWGSGATNRMINKKQTKYYERNIRSNKVEYGTAADVYCTMHDVKVPFCMPDFSSSKIINHRFHVGKDKGESVIGYDMIIIRDLIVQLGLTAEFKRQFLQWDGATVNTKEPILSDM